MIDVAAPTRVTVPPASVRAVVNSDRIGVDIQDVKEIAESSAYFEDCHLHRVCHNFEVEIARGQPRTAPIYLAGQCAGCEAVLKLLEVEEALSVWPHTVTSGIESVSHLELRAAVCDIAVAQGITEIILSAVRTRCDVTAVAMARFPLKSTRWPI